VKLSAFPASGLSQYRQGGWYESQVQVFDAKKENIQNSAVLYTGPKQHVLVGIRGMPVKLPPLIWQENTLSPQPNQLNARHIMEKMC
jgi:hypothetical protein